MSYSEKHDVLLLSSHLTPTQLWMIGHNTRSDELVSLSNGRDWRVPRDLSINQVTAAPMSSSLFSTFIGTNAGIVFVDARRQVHYHPSITTSSADADEQKPRRLDVLSQSFHPSNQSIVYVGLRSSQIYCLDTRIPTRAVTQLRHTSSVAQLSTLESDENRLIAAGPRSAMAIYDIRCLRRQPNLHKNQGTTPVLNFPTYTNDAHIQIGFAVHQGGQAVAAADSDGGVGIYSLLSGRRLASPAIDAIKSDGIIKALRFETLGEDRHASLWVGLAGGVEKYSVL
jgi:WD40 repeat protein